MNVVAEIVAVVPPLAGNSVQRMAAALGVFLGLSLAFRFIIPAVLEKMDGVSRKTATKTDDEVVSHLQSVPRWVYLALALFIGLSVLRLPDTAHAALRAGILVLVISAGASLAQRIIACVLLTSVPGLRTQDGTVPAALRIVIAVALWTFGVLLILSNLGVNVVSLVAGLGIGGIAVALAAQNILGDIFSSFALYLDRPFREGDFIVVGSHMGVVKKIGLKTTRIQALQGEEIIIANQELTSARVQNFKRMRERRVLFRFGVTHDATPIQLRAVAGIVRKIIESKPLARFDRAHFAAFGESSLEFEVVYYVDSGDYNAYMDLQQEINLAIYERLRAEGIAFAFPTRTVHLAGARGHAVSVKA